jgi:hypothetical protein
MKEKSYLGIFRDSITMLILLIAFIVSFFTAVANAQTYEFSNTSPAVKLGRFSTTAGYTFTVAYRANSGTHFWRTLPFYEVGNQKASISWPYMLFNNWQILLDQKVGYPTLMDGQFHQLTWRVGNGVIEFLIDSILVGSQMSDNVSFNADLWLGSNSSIDKLSGTIQNPQFFNYYVANRNEKPMPKGSLYKDNLPIGLVWDDESGEWNWSGVKPLYQQLSEFFKAYPLEYAQDAIDNYKIPLMFDFHKLGGEDDSTVSDDSAITAGVAIAKLMADYGNCRVRMIGNSTDYMSYRNNMNSTHGRFNAAMIALVNSNPKYKRINVDCSYSQLDDIAGYKHITTQQFANMLPNEPITTFDGDAGILFTHYSTIQAVTNKPITDAMFDNEYANKWLDTTRYAANPACKAAKEASGLSWWDYCSKQYTAAMTRVLDGIRRACPGIQIVEYDVNMLDECQYYYEPKFKYRIGLNTNGIGFTRMGTDQLYPRNMRALLMGYGDHRGLLNYEQLSKRGQTKLGYNNSTPFVGIGYLGDPWFDIDATHTIGLETFLVATGSPYLYPSLYVQSSIGNNPNSKALATQLVAASIAQSACKNAWDIVVGGVLQPGDRTCEWLCFGGTNYTDWFGDFEVVAGVRKLGNRYLISTFYGSCTAIKNKTSRKKSGTINIASKPVNVEAHDKTFLYVYDSTKPISADNPKRIGTFVQVGSVDGWAYRKASNKSEN